VGEYDRDADLAESLQIGAYGIWPTEAAPVIRRREHGVELGTAALEISVSAAEGSADHQFAVRGPAIPERALPRPGVALLEFTGTKSPKSKWKFTNTGEDWFCLAGLWRPMPAPPDLWPPRTPPRFTPA
jgi:hypothetical protein